MIDSLAVGGDLLRNVLVYGASPEVKAAYAAAWPDKAQQMSFEEAVRNTSDAKLPSLVSAVKGKLFEQKYAAYLNDGHLPAGYSAELAHSANQPGWDIAIHGPDIQPILAIPGVAALILISGKYLNGGYK